MHTQFGSQSRSMELRDFARSSERPSDVVICDYRLTMETSVQSNVVRVKSYKVVCTIHMPVDWIDGIVPHFTLKIESFVISSGCILLETRRWNQGRNKDLRKVKVNLKKDFLSVAWVLRSTKLIAKRQWKEIEVRKLSADPFDSGDDQTDWIAFFSEAALGSSQEISEYRSIFSNISEIPGGKTIILENLFKKSRTSSIWTGFGRVNWSRSKPQSKHSTERREDWLGYWTSAIWYWI